jgi:gliding motility-associated protein GldM
MALPREPRQKMINIMYLVLTAILALNVSNEVINAFKVVDKSLMASNSSLTGANSSIYTLLQKKLTDPQSAEKAKIWKPKADQAKVLTDDIYNYIENLKHDLKINAGLRMKEPKAGTTDSIEDYREDNLDAATRMFDTKGEGEKLQKRLEKYKEDLLNLDNFGENTSNDPGSIRKKFPNLQFDTDTKEFKTAEGQPKDFTQTYFHMTPTVAALTMLSKFENNIKNAENKVVTHCLNQVGAVEIVFNKFEPIATTNSTYIMPGQEMTVTAGVGAFNDAAKPVITIDGAVTPLNDNGVAERKFMASGGGAHKVHVHIDYKDPSGKPASLDKDIDYTVGTPGGSAVMLDKMNVFYIGVENPVTINSGTGWDKTHVSISGGGATIKPGSGPGHFLVSATTPGKDNVTITVQADKSTSSFQFNVKPIPDPVVAVGSKRGGGRMPSVDFKNQQFMRADLGADFVFQGVRYNVISATMYFSGANFPSVQQANISGASLAPAADKMNKSIPGTSITFDNVKVQGPDGKVRSIDGAGFILY